MRKKLLYIIMILFFVLVACDPKRAYNYHNVYKLNSNPFVVVDTLTVVKDSYDELLGYHVIVEVDSLPYYAIIDENGEMLFFNPESFKYDR